MSGRVDGFEVIEIGWPLLASSKWSPSTNREAKIWSVPPTLSVHATQGTVGFAESIVPAATRGSCAPLATFLFNEQPASAVPLAGEAPAVHGPPVDELSSTWGPSPAVPPPTTCQWNPPSAVPSATPLAANTRSLLCSPVTPLTPVSYQTTHGTVSFGPVKAMSGSMPSRVRSTFSDGSALSTR